MNKQSIKDVQGYKIAKQFIEDLSLIGEPMKLHMSRMTSPLESQCITSGLIAYTKWFEDIENSKDGFQIQLMSREGILYHNPESFFGEFDYFEVKQYSITHVLHIQYKDKSFFDIEVFF